jgi:hypothetical protein
MQDVYHVLFLLRIALVPILCLRALRSKIMNFEVPRSLYLKLIVYDADHKLIRSSQFNLLVGRTND